MNPEPPRSAVRRALASFGRAALKLLKVGFVVLLVVIPIPVATLFIRLFNPKRGTDSAQVLEKK
jgi:hypothetical protein